MTGVQTCALPIFTVVLADGAVFVTALAPATVNEFRIAEPVTGSLNVSMIVFNPVLAAVNVGDVLSVATALVPSATSFADESATEPFNAR